VTDRYDDRAKRIVCGLSGYAHGPHCLKIRERVAAALRESAAEAFEEAGQFMAQRDRRVPWSPVATALYFAGKAAALRSTTRGKP
jgi:hypothetical protein